MPYGYNGKRIIVNLTSGKIDKEKPSENWYRKYLGGMCSVAYHLLDKVKPGTDPLSPHNTLILATGVITGGPFSGSGRNAVGAKSPLTGAFGEADAGGFWGAELKLAGYDEIIFKGKSETPVLLRVHNEEVELMDASKLWGLQVGECQDQIRKQLEDKQIKTALIGPSGENLSREACVINDLNHVAGRCGLGAAMGAKKLKGVAVRGTNKLELADPKRVATLAKTIIERISTESRGLQEYGTGRNMEAGALIGNLPTRNFQDGAWPYAALIDGRAIKDQYRTGMSTCYSCALMCKKEVTLKEPYIVESRYGGPEYETLGAFGSDCDITDLAAICKANELCQRYGLDTIGIGATIAFAMECYENGIIDKDTTGGIELTFGNAEAMLQVLELIGKREGIGDILADGSHRAANTFGGGFEYLVEVKGQEVPMHEPRLKRGLGLGYAVSPTGADHCHNMHDTGIVGTSLAKLRPLGILQEVPIDNFGPEKVRLFNIVMQTRILANCLSVCSFPPWRYTEYLELVQAITGWDMSMYELMEVAERTLTLARVFNIREGFTREDDWLPPRFFQPQTSGPLSKTSVDPDQLQEAIDTYYAMMGWTERGVPTKGTLHRLGVGWTAKHIPID